MCRSRKLCECHCMYKWNKWETAFLEELCCVQLQLHHNDVNWLCSNLYCMTNTCYISNRSTLLLFFFSPCSLCGLQWAVPWLLFELWSKQCSPSLSFRHACMLLRLQLIFGKIMDETWPAGCRGWRIRCIMHMAWLKRIVVLFYPLTAQHRPPHCSYSLSATEVLEEHHVTTRCSFNRLGV